MPAHEREDVGQPERNQQDEEHDQTCAMRLLFLCAMYGAFFLLG